MGRLYFKLLEKLFDHGAVDMVVETVQMIVPTYRDNKEEKNENKQKVESIERYKHKKKNVSESYYD